ncbi:Arylsulfatase [Rubripirellula amarantea]|uniref:Arylsulfatase n=1 Tax=Rubripirellula amarantea TaxID=2527999 RepID=A0A5C5WVD2_9BACT|nr:sulfatase-like hydrolase/transferase [Rubripirellula amarantea]TWT54568.1 Arylsulfatase [Rubripirellula amarantea]
MIYSQWATLAVVALSVTSIAFADEPRPTKPNIVLLLTDDLGWQDVKCYDIDEPSPMETPNIDSMADRGIKFWQAYSPAPTCAPSRCAIMSGNHPARAQKTHVVGGSPPTPYNKNVHRMMEPWYSGRMPENEMTLARALQQNGYVTGHCGKWHMAIDHHAFPQPEDQGFDWTRHNLGTTAKMKPHRLTGFATEDANDPYRLDENGFAYHQNSEDALTFVRDHSAQPFFLYYATWLVHAPIQTRSEARLLKYCKKLGVELPETPSEWNGDGQTNPFYCAMVEELDYHVGRVVDLLDQTDDPRWPGHKLSENTYVIFTSDNGAMERHPGEIITDNYPLDRGKISAMEGGTRVPLIVFGPEIAKGVESDVMINGLDFYPTILSLTGTPVPNNKSFDGYDLADLLLINPRDPALVREPDGEVRDTMVWHFPNSIALESTIRIGDYKLVRNYDHLNNPTAPAELELYQLYRTEDGKQHRVDIEEANNLASSLPQKAQQMNNRLSEILTEMKASYPYFNPNVRTPLPHKEQVCTVDAHHQRDDQVEFSYTERGAVVTKANLIYTLNGGEKSEEWFRTPAKLVSSSKVTATLPQGTTHYFINLIDENNFLRSYPEVVDKTTHQKSNVPYSATALVNVNVTTKTKSKVNRSMEGQSKRQIAFVRWDTNRDQRLSFDEYKAGLLGQANLERRFKTFDKNNDGHLDHDEFK